ncbi:MAG: hypothetical protein V4858_09830 [Pseudomonadota bacterium]
MARPANHQRDEAFAALRTLTTQHGTKEGVRLARERFPTVPAGTWGRWKQQAVGSLTSAEALSRTILTAELRRNIPAPAELAASIPATRRALDFWRMLDELELDAKLMRDFALTQGADGKLKLRVPFALRDAHRMRCDLIRLALAQAEAAWSVERAQSFFDEVVTAIGAESPDCQWRIMERLRLVHGEAGARGF